MIRARKRVKRGWRGANWKRAVKMASLAKDDIDIFISRFHVCRSVSTILRNGGNILDEI